MTAGLSLMENVLTPLAKMFCYDCYQYLFLQYNSINHFEWRNGWYNENIKSLE